MSNLNYNLIYIFINMFDFFQVAEITLRPSFDNMAHIVNSS